MKINARTEVIPEEWTVEEIVALRKAGRLFVKPRYQRDIVWEADQMRLFIDSMLRGYHVPLLYLRRHAGEDGAGRYEIIDGQQRIETLFGFAEHVPVIVSNTLNGKIRRPIPPLFDPAEEGVFPDFLRRTPCLWAKKTFKTLEEEDKQYFSGRNISVALVEGNDNQVTDMFIRLQGGSSLTEQERRDAWPGNLCELVLKTGGKRTMELDGHNFFRELFSNPSPDRGQIRQVVAQILLLFLLRKEKGADEFISIGRKNLDDCYYQNTGLYLKSDNVVRFRDILDKLYLLFQGRIAPLKNHDAIHLILFTDMLMDDFDSAWEKGIVDAFKHWQGEMGQVKTMAHSPADELESAWIYALYPGPNPDKIHKRHGVYVSRMFDLLGDNLRAKCPEDGLTDDLREAVYYRDGKKCCECGQEVEWKEFNDKQKGKHAAGKCPLLSNTALICGKHECRYGS
ncbi:MAG: DUF262 domain-containing protein [Gammaproteobacteria bacterium]